MGSERGKGLLRPISELGRDEVMSNRSQAENGAGGPPEIGKKRVTPRKGDLVRLRRLSLDNQRGRKLEPRWEGPYSLTQVVHHGQSEWLHTLHYLTTEV